MRKEHIPLDNNMVVGPTGTSHLLSDIQISSG